MVYWYCFILLKIYNMQREHPYFHGYINSTKNEVLTPLLFPKCFNTQQLYSFLAFRNSFGLYLLYIFCLVIIRIHYLFLADIQPDRRPIRPEQFISQ